jgi:RNA polymerase sigma-70 factor (ECF subfamily)
MEEGGAAGPITDEELMKSFLQGAEGAFDELVGRYSGRITNFIYRQVAHFPTAEELAQDTFLAVYRKKDTFREGYAFSAWLYKIAINFCRMHFRKKKSLPQTFSIEESQEEGRMSLEAALVDTGEAPPEALGRREMEEKLRRAIDDLPNKQRLVFTLSFYEEMTYEEIAGVLGCSPGTVASRKHAAVKKLASRLRRVAPEEVGFGRGAGQNEHFA